MQVKTFSTIDHIKENEWNQLVHPDDVFNNFHFHKALEISKSIGSERGQIPNYITVWESGELKAACVVYIKGHSYGEYIFDWSWADFYERHGKNYYPKVIAQNPFTPANNRTFLYKDSKYIKDLCREIEKINEEYNCSSSHLLFLDKDELTFAPEDYKTRSSFQYHWKNNGYIDFEDFLSHLKNKKTKQIKKERETNLVIRTIPSEELSMYVLTFYNLYISTIKKKNSYAYLNLDFFAYIFKNMSESVRLLAAFDKDQLVAGSLFFIGENKLYGRYWGTLEEYSNLHFELCYYQGIDLAIKNNIETFEAGAQGEHKIARGFEPTCIYSAHKINSDLLKLPIYNFIDEEKKQIDSLFIELNKKLPFKKI